MSPRIGSLGTTAFVALLALGCGRRELRDLSRASDEVATAVRRGDGRALSEKVVVGARNRVDYPAILSDKQRRAEWSRRLAKPDAVRPTATV